MLIWFRLVWSGLVWFGLGWVEGLLDSVFIYVGCWTSTRPIFLFFVPFLGQYVFVKQGELTMLPPTSPSWPWCLWVCSSSCRPSMIRQAASRDDRRDWTQRGQPVTQATRDSWAIHMVTYLEHGTSNMARDLDGSVSLRLGEKE